MVHIFFWAVSSLSFLSLNRTHLLSNKMNLLWCVFNYSVFSVWVIDFRFDSSLSILCLANEIFSYDSNILSLWLYYPGSLLLFFRWLFFLLVSGIKSFLTFPFWSRLLTSKTASVTRPTIQNALKSQLWLLLYYGRVLT